MIIISKSKPEFILGFLEAVGEEVLVLVGGDLTRDFTRGFRVERLYYRVLRHHVLFNESKRIYT